MRQPKQRNFAIFYAFLAFIFLRTFLPHFQNKQLETCFAANLYAKYAQNYGKTRDLKGGGGGGGSSWFLFGIMIFQILVGQNTLWAV